MSKKPGFCTTTYRFRLYCDNIQLLHETKLMYNRVLKYYYDVIRKEPDIWDVPKLQMMRALELLTIGSRGESSDDTKYPFPFEKVPLYFRRAAINDAIRLQGSFRASEENGTNEAAGFDASPIYYKGMYKEFTSTSINLKLYDGAKWIWQLCVIDTCGRTMPAEEQIMSPVLVLNKGRAMLHVPVKEEVVDVRTVKERLGGEEQLCAAYFPNSDTMAVLVVLNAEGKILKTKFINGGRELVHRKKVCLKRIEENRKSMGGDKEKLPAEENKALKEKIHRITDDVAHKVSREIVDFCVEQNVNILVVPNYKQSMLLKQPSVMTIHIQNWSGRKIAVSA